MAGYDGLVSEASSLANQTLLNREGYAQLATIDEYVTSPVISLIEARLKEGQRIGKTMIESCSSLYDLPDGRRIVLPDGTQTVRLMYRAI